MLNPLNFISKFIKSNNQKELDRIAKIVTKKRTQNSASMRNIYSSRLIKLETRFEQRGTYSDAMFISGASKTISSGIFFSKV